MIYFNSLACQQAFMGAVEATPQLWALAFRLLNRQKPCALYLVGGDKPDYFDFGVFRRNIQLEKIGDTERPDLTVMPPFVPDRNDLVVNGGLCLREDGTWSSHT